MVMERSVWALRVSVSVAVLLPGDGSTCPAPTMTVAELTRLPVLAEFTVPPTVTVKKLAAPAGRLMPVKSRLLPADAFVPQLAVPLATQLIVAPMMAAGMASVMLAPVAFAGPALETVMV